MSNQDRERSTLLVAMLAAAMMLAACGSSHEVVYRCTGSTNDVAVVYTGEDGETVEEMANLPWEVVVERSGNSLATSLEVENQGDSGNITCEVLVDGEQMFDASGEESLFIDGAYAIEGNTTSASYSGGGVAREVVEAPEEQPQAGETVDFLLINNGPVNICGLFITLSDATDWGPNRFPAGTVVEPGSTYTLTDVPSDVYDLKVETCGNEIISWNMGADFGMLGEQFGGELPLEITGEPILLISNNTGESICSLGVRPATAETWFRNLFSEGQTIEPGAQMRVWLPPGQHDIGADSCSGTRTMLEDVTITGQHTWDITG